MKAYLKAPRRDYLLIGLLAVFLLIDVFWKISHLPLATIALLGALPTLASAVRATREKRISIDSFNSFAIIITLVTWEIQSAAFIALMLAFARLLEWFTETRTTNAVEELLKLKPQTAVQENDAGETREIPVSEVKEGDVVIVKTGARVPVDGTIIFGTALFNEASVTGESALAEKSVGDEVLSSTLSENGIVKVRATHVGKESLIERMAALIKDAEQNKSKTQRIADRFATLFLPIVAIIGLATFLITRSLDMMVALFLVACADDIAVSIPLAMTASLGQAAKRGVIIKGGEYFERLGKLTTLVLDKTGTLTYGHLAVTNVQRVEDSDRHRFWTAVAGAERYSEHPVGKAVLKAAQERTGSVPEATDVQVIAGKGIRATVEGIDVAIGNPALAEALGIRLTAAQQAAFAHEEAANETVVLVLLNGAYAGVIRVGDTPRPEARATLDELRRLGVARIVMLTGDNERVARTVAEALGITDVRASVTPEGKFAALEELKGQGTMAMIGDGINDAPALARADLGIAMGGGGTAVAVEAANVVILTDNLARVPHMVTLGRRTMSVIRGDVIIWFVTNALGFALVFTGIIGPILAAAYNFLTDFLPIINSTRLFRWKR